MRVAVTGANGAVGRAIVRAVLERADVRVLALVRSERAAGEVPEIPAERGGTGLVDYDAEGSLASALVGVDALIHLPGLLVERRDSSYETANVATTRSAVAAARASGVAKLVLVSACGAAATARNRFFRTKGEAEELVEASGIPNAILRAPLVLGRDTEGARALLRDSEGPVTWLLGGGATLHRPLDAEDLAAGALAACDPEVARDRTLELVGPTPLSYAELVARAAQLRGRSVRVRRVPVGPVRAFLRARRALLGPGFDHDVLGVLLADTFVDPGEATAALAIPLRPLDVTIAHSLDLPEPA